MGIQGNWTAGLERVQSASRHTKGRPHISGPQPRSFPRLCSRLADPRNPESAAQQFTAEHRAAGKFANSPGEPNRAPSIIGLPSLIRHRGVAAPHTLSASRTSTCNR